MAEKYFALQYYGGLACIAVMAIAAVVFIIKIWWDSRR